MSPYRTTKFQKAIYLFLVFSMLTTLFPVAALETSPSSFVEGSGPDGVMMPWDWFDTELSQHALPSVAQSNDLAASNIVSNWYNTNWRNNRLTPSVAPSTEFFIRSTQTIYLPVVANGDSQSTGTITPSGGTATSADGNIVAQFAPNAVSEPTEIFIDSVQDTHFGPASNGFSMIGDPFTLNAFSEGNGNPITYFPPEVLTETVTITDGVELTQYLVTPRVDVDVLLDEPFPEGADKQRAALHYWDTSSRDWLPMLSTWDETGTWLQTATDHFTAFALMAPAAAITGTTSYVVIDPDHGGSDPGGRVTSPASYYAEEKNFNLDISLTAQQMLEACGVSVDMTRVTDSNVSYPDRAAFINSRNPDLSVTVAVNILRSYMSYYTGSGPEAWAKMLPSNVGWANTTLDSIVTQTGLTSRGVKNAAGWGQGRGLYLPLTVSDDIAHLQAETAFMDNYYDRAILDDHPEWFAEAVFNAVVAELGLEGDDCTSVAASPLRSLYRRVYGYPSWLPGGSTGYTGIVGDPIFAPVGNVVYQQQDMFVNNSGIPWTVERTYNGFDNFCEGSFGCGWSSNLDSFLWVNESGEIDWRLPDGQVYIFVPNGDGSYANEAGVFEEMTDDGDGYLITFPDQTEWAFDSSGYLVTITERSGNEINFTRDADGLPLSATDPAGRNYTFTLNGNGNITAISGPTGDLSYAYDGDSLTSATNLNGDTTTYVYDGNGRLESITDPVGNTFVQNTYNENGRLASQVDATGTTLTLDYDTGSNETVVTDSTGRQYTYQYDDLYRPIRVTDPNGNEEVFEYDTSYNLLRYTDETGATTVRTYDERGNMTSKTNPLGNSDSYAFDADNNLTSETDALGNTTTYSHDAQGNLTGFTDSAGNSTSIAYDGNGRPTSLTDSNDSHLTFTYDVNGHIDSVTDALGNTTTYINDAAGRQLGITDANGHTTTKTYNDWGDVLTITDPKGNSYSFTYDANHNLTSVTDALNRTWSYTYDENDRLIDFEDPAGGHTLFTYDAHHNVLSNTDANGNTVSYVYDDLDNLLEIHNPRGGVTTYEYDARGRMTHITDALGNDLTFTYDLTGRVTRIEDALGNTLHKEYDALGQLVRETDARGYLTDFTYDELGNLTIVLDAIGQASRFEYDDMGNVIRAIYPDGGVSTYKRDPLGRLLAVTDQLGNSIHYVYDPIGNILTITDRNGNDISYTYDENNNRESVTSSLNSIMSYEYDAVNNLSRVINPNGHDTTYAYDVLDRLTSTVNALGYAYSFTYDGVGNPLTMTDPEGGITTFGYDTEYNLTQRATPLGFSTQFTYDLVGNLTDVLDANGGLTQYVYSDIYQPIQIIDAENYNTFFSYDAAGNALTWTDENGDITSYEYDPLNRLTQMIDGRNGVHAYTYDPMGRRTSYTDPMGGVTLYGRDLIGQLTSLTDALGYIQNFTYDGEGNLLTETDANGNVTTYTYDADERLTQMTDAKGFMTAYEYDPVGNLTQATDALGGVYSYQHDELERLTQSTDPLNGLAQFTYDGLDRVVNRIDPRGGITAFVYDADSRLAAVTNPLGDITSYTYDPLNNLLTTTDANNHTYTNAYNLRNLVVSHATPLGHTSQYSYDGVGNMVQTTNPRGYTTDYAYDPSDNLVQMTDPLGGVWQNGYDLNNNLTDVTNPNGNTTTYAYDAVNNLLSETLPMGEATQYVYDGNRNRQQIINAKGAVTTFAYDPVNLTTQTVDPLGNITSYEYDGLRNMTQMIDAMGYPTEFEYDLLSRLTLVTDALNQQTAYAYDPMGALLSVTDANNHITSFEVDLIGQVTAEENAIGSRWEYTLDPVGNLTNRLDANGDNTVYTYDADDRLIAQSYPDGRVDAFVYDENNNLLNLDDPTGLSTATYDALDRLASIDKSGSLLEGEFAYDYDPASNLTSLIYPDGKEMTYGYNANEWLVEATDPMSGPTAYEYDPVGLATRITYPNDTESLYTYDLDNRVTQVYNQKSGGSTDVISVHDYNYDAVDNVIQVVDTFTSGQLVHVDKSYLYDGNGQLLTVDEVPDFQQGNLVHTEYTYDPVGNRLQMDTDRPEKNGPPNPPTRTIDYTYDDANRMLTSGDDAFAYDANGNRLQEYGPDTSTGNPNDFYRTDYAYDYENRLVNAEGTRIQSNGHEQFDYEADFSYDGLNRRVEKGERDQGMRKATGYLYDGWSFDPLAEKLTPGQPLTTYYYRDPVQILSRHEIQGDGKGLQYWYHYDALGNVTANSNHAGLSVHEYRYEEYGDILDINGKPDDSDNWTDPHNHYLWSGKEFDEETELTYFGSRYYDADNGVWLTQDSYRGDLNKPMTLHRFSYVGNNPTSYIDLYGFIGFSIKIGKYELKADVSRQGVSGDISSNGQRKIGGSVTRQDGGFKAEASIDTRLVKGDAYADVSYRDGKLKANGGVTGSAYVGGNTYGVNAHGQIEASCGNGHGCYVDGAGRAQITKNGETIFDKGGQFSVGYKAPPRGILLKKGAPIDPPSTSLLDEVNDRFNAGNERLERYNQSVAIEGPQFIADLKESVNTGLDVFQTVLDVVGLIPVIGEPVDLVNGVIYLGRGKYVDAGLSFVAIIPVVGSVGTGGKLFTKGVKVVDTIDTVNDTRKLINTVDTINDTQKIINKIEPVVTGTNVVYQSVVDGVVKYVGITNDFARRAGEHDAIRIIQKIPGLSQLSRYDARAVEQALIEYNKLAKNGGTLDNLINSIATTNPKYADAIERGWEILRKTGNSTQ